MLAGIATYNCVGRKPLVQASPFFLQTLQNNCGLVLGTREEEAIYDILKISSPHSLIAELLRTADAPTRRPARSPHSKVVLQECSTEICPAKWGNAMQRLPQMSLGNIHGHFFCSLACGAKHAR